MKITYEWEPSDIIMGMVIRRQGSTTFEDYYIVGYRIPSLKEKEIGMTCLADGLWFSLSEKNDLNMVINHLNAYRYEPVAKFTNPPSGLG